MTAFKRPPIKSFKEFLNARTKSPETIANQSNAPIAKIKKAIKTGAKIEGEHTKHKNIAREIAADHLGELGLGYYPALDKMEKSLKSKKSRSKK